MEFQDKTIVCKLRREEFVWNSGEQQFYHDYDLSPPRKCPACRADMKRKVHRQREEQRVREEGVGHG